MKQVVDVADWQTSSDNMLLYNAGSFCVLKSPAHLTFHSTRCLTALPWNQRVGRWQLFAARPTIDTTIRAGVRRDRGSLYCDGCSPCCSGGGSNGGEADDWGGGAGGNPGSSCSHEAVLCLGGDDANLVVVSDFYHCHHVCPHLSCMNVVVLAVDGPN